MIKKNYSVNEKKLIFWKHRV